MELGELTNSLVYECIKEKISLKIILILVILNILLQLFYFLMNYYGNKNIHEKSLTFYKNKSRIERSISIHEEIYSKIIHIKDSVFYYVFTNTDKNKLEEEIKEIRYKKTSLGLYINQSIDKIIDELLDYYSIVLVDKTTKNDEKEIELLRNYQDEFKKIG